MCVTTVTVTFATVQRQEMFLLSQRKLSRAVTLTSYILEVAGSNHSRHTDYID
jgi:hypothetical protein